MTRRSWRALLQAAQERLHAGQGLLPLETGSGGGRPVGQPVVEGTASLIVWDALRGMFDALGFDAVKDEAFTSLEGLDGGAVIIESSVWFGSPSR